MGPAFFSDENLRDLRQGRHDVQAAWERLRDRIVGRRYKSDKAAEYAKHGLTRRLYTLVRCIDHVFDILPPSRQDIVLSTN
ncbi:MAG: hypothetical protein H0W83_08110 [Planctomycetes bacterium]|nr:hypothetical protein [Planctomycetota bacterium]